MKIRGCDSVVSCPVLTEGRSNSSSDLLEVQPGSSSWSADGNERLCVLAQRSEELLWGVWCLTAQWADGELLLLSAVSDLGSQSRVLLANGLVVLQDPLQVGHRLVPILTLNLQRDGIRMEREEVRNKILIAEERKKQTRFLHLMTSWVIYS